MKLDSNNLTNNGDDQTQESESLSDSRQNAADLLDDILSQFSYQSANSHVIPNQALTETSSLIDMLQHTLQIRPQVETPGAENGAVEGIDPASPLGNSLRNKFTELDEISQRLKSRLNQVVCDDNIILSPDTEFGSLEADLERDLNTDCQDEDLSPQEFSVLMRSVQNSSSPHKDVFKK